MKVLNQKLPNINLASDTSEIYFNRFEPDFNKATCAICNDTDPYAFKVIFGNPICIGESGCLKFFEMEVDSSKFNEAIELSNEIADSGFPTETEIGRLLDGTNPAKKLEKDIAKKERNGFSFHEKM